MLADKTYVELIGLPGAGKTQAADEIVRLAGEGVFKRGPLDVPWWQKYVIGLRAAGKLLLTPLLWKLWLTPINSIYREIAHTPSVVRNMRIRLVLESVIIHRCLSRQSVRVLINDEGLVGRLVVLSVVTSLSKEEASRVLKILMPRPTLLVYVTTEWKKSIEREKERKIDLPFFNDMPSEIKESFFRECTEIYDQWCLDLEDHSGISSVRVTNTGSLEDFQEEIRRFGPLL